MESQLFPAQDKISAAERCTKLREQKNEYLQKELDSWNEDTTPEFTSNLQFVASGSGIPSLGMTVSLPAISMQPSVSMLVMGGPQVTSISMSGSTLGPTPFGVLRAIVVPRLVLYLMRCQDKVEATMEMMAMVELLDPKLYKHSRRVYRPSLCESSPDTLRCSMDGPMKMCQRGWRRSRTFSI